MFFVPVIVLKSSKIPFSPSSTFPFNLFILTEILGLKFKFWQIFAVYSSPYSSQNFFTIHSGIEYFKLILVILLVILLISL